jgi:transposase
VPRRVTLVRHLGKEELERRYRDEKDPRTKERLLAILLLYDGKKVSEIPPLVRRSRASVEEWLSRWNDHGVDGLTPHFTGGPKPWITSEEWDLVIEEIEEKGMTIQDVTSYVRKTRGVSYAYKTVWEILRKKKHVRYGKPYIRNRLRPENAEEILKKESTMPYQNTTISRRSL